MTEAARLYDMLVECIPPQLDAITVKLQLSEKFLPGRGEETATRAKGILTLAKQRGAKGLADLEKALNEVLGRTPAQKRKPGTPRVQKRPVPRVEPAVQGDASAVSDAIVQPTRDATQLRTIRIFLASSAELREDRDAFDLYFRQQNDRFLKRGLYLQIDRWENFLDEMSETRLQDEYNEAVRNCDVFVSLFFTKTGKFTEEEFDTAYAQRTATGKPHVYTFFKNAAVNTGSVQEKDMKSLWAFRRKLEKKLGHFCTEYGSIEDLKLKFRDQLDRLYG